MDKKIIINFIRLNIVLTYAQLKIYLIIFFNFNLITFNKPLNVLKLNLFMHIYFQINIKYKYKKYSLYEPYITRV